LTQQVNTGYVKVLFEAPWQVAGGVAKGS